MRRKGTPASTTTSAAAPKRRGLSPIFFILAFVVLLLAVWLFLGRGGDETATPAGPAVTLVTLVCNDECADRGQCGRLADGRYVVLAHPDQPAVRDHQLLFAADSTAALVATNVQTVQVIATGEQFDQPFYQLTRPEDGRSAWVAGWCVLP
jgi:hypothetical protein